MKVKRILYNLIFYYLYISLSLYFIFKDRYDWFKLGFRKIMFLNLLLFIILILLGSKIEHRGYVEGLEVRKQSLFIIMYWLLFYILNKDLNIAFKMILFIIGLIFIVWNDLSYKKTTN